MPPFDGFKLGVGGAGCPVLAGYVGTSMRLVYPGDVAADVQALPFRDNSVAGIECDAVLEHVPKPVLAVAEMARVLRPGSFLHVVVPFQQPLHPYPSDYQRWTIRGLRELLPASQFE